MNKRIKELAEQSGCGWDDKYHWYVGNEQMKKIAELIVRECAEIADKAEPYKTSDLIKKHFGVEP
jgi:hypothetical protein